MVLNYQKYIGPFSQINQKLLLANVNLSGDTLRTKHNIAAKLQSEQEGEYIVRNRVYAGYGWHRNIFKEYWLGAGVYMGMAGYAYQGGSAYTQGSDWAPDGDVGIVFYRPQKLTLAFSTNQAFNSIVRPKDLEFRWTRYYTGYVQRYFEHDKEWTSSLYLQHILRTDVYSNTDIGAYLSYKQHLLLGTNFTFGNKLSAMAGFQNLPLRIGTVSVLFNYNFPFITQQRTRISAYELTVLYGFFTHGK